MSLLQDTIQAIQAPSAGISEIVKERMQVLLEGDTPQLGKLLPLLCRYLDIRGCLHPAPPQKATVICCADHGVSQEGVSAYPPETTAQMTRNYLISRGAAANAFSDFAGSDLFVVNMGIAVPMDDIPELIDRCIAPGTADMVKGPAMTRSQAEKSLLAGIELAETLIAKGYDCFLPGEMGIANTTSSAAIAAVFCGLTPEQATGRGTNISDERLKHKIGIVRQALAINQPDASDGLDVLAKIGGFEFGCIAGLILGAAAHHCTVILDGANSSAAALIAQALAPGTAAYLLPSHLGSERSHRHMLKKLGLSPFLRLDLRLGETGGSAIASDLLASALAAWQVIDRKDVLEEEPPFDHRHMGADNPHLTDKTFDFYFQTILPLDRPSMERCQHRIDNLAKPIYSLGALEQIAVEYAGIDRDERPAIIPQDLSLLCFTGQKSNDLQLKLTQAFADQAGFKVCLAHLYPSATPAAAFNFGRECGEEMSSFHAVVGLAATEVDPDAPFGTMAADLHQALLLPDGSLRYAEDEFLQHTPVMYRNTISALMGAILAAARNSSLILLDDETTCLAARYTVKLCPAVRPYLLPVQPELLQLDLEIPGGLLACLGSSILKASMDMLNNMKTFAETDVAVAADGPGAGRQER